METEQVQAEAARARARRGRLPLLQAREEGRVGDRGPALERLPADPRAARLAAEAGAAARRLALGDHPAAPGRRARGRDGDPALLDGAPRRRQALLHDDGAGRGAPHRGLAPADRARGRPRRARPVPRQDGAARHRRGHARGEGLPDAGLLRAADHPQVPRDREVIARHGAREPLQPPRDRRRHPSRSRRRLRAGPAARRDARRRRASS